MAKYKKKLEDDIRCPLEYGLAVLAATLKDMIEDGIVDRKSYDEIPPKVEYSLTKKGKSVVPILQSIC